MNFIFDLVNTTKEEDFTTSKKDVLKYLKIIGVDTRFISYTPEKIYINNLRFSKFSKTRQETFEDKFESIKVVRNSLFQKICAKAAKTLTNDIKPNNTVLMPEDNYLVELILEPYTRKYGVKLVWEGDYDLAVNAKTLDEEVSNIFSSIFKGEDLEFSRKENEIYPLLNVSEDMINRFLEGEGQKIIKNESSDEIATSFMEFLEDVSPQYRENVLKACEFIELKTEK